MYYLHISRKNTNRLLVAIVKGDIVLLIVFLRAALLYVVVVFAIRLMGKRQLGELQPSEFVITILISNIATLPIEDPGTPMLLGIVPILTLVCLDVIMSAATLRSRKLRRIVSGSPKIIISNGEIDQKQLKELRYTADDVLEALRSQGIFDVSEVQYAVIETTGAVSAYLKSSKQPRNGESVRPTDDPPQVVIDDGDVVKRSLGFLGLTEAWLSDILNGEKKTPHDVFLMTARSDGSYKIIEKEKGV